MDTDLLLTAEDMTTNEIRDLINALKALLEEKETEDIEVNIGDMVEFEIKKGVTASGIVLAVTPKRVTVKVHQADGEASSPINGITVTTSAPMPKESNTEALEAFAQE
tara:strand:- start:127 stop:450 length:324 start_codon:yes stop_codon:yes gene_type:complete